MLTEKQARNIVILLSTKQPYIPGEGARCPLCLIRAPVTGTKGDGLRQHKCPRCGHSFASVEKLEKTVESGQSLEKKDKRRNSRVKRK